MKTVAILTIGNEILDGKTLNTNSQFLSQLLFKQGYKVISHMAILDDPLVIQEEVTRALIKADVVISTGGLGPTCDDRTKESLLMIASQIGVLKNPLGTALGLIMQQGEKILFALPGVPQEMEEMAKMALLPFLLSNLPLDDEYVYQEYFLAFHNELEVDPFLRSLKGIEVGIYPNYGYLTVTLAARGKTKKEAKSHLEGPMAEFEKKFGRYLFTAKDGRLGTAICDLFCENGLTLSVAESCTGGLIASHLTKTPGASQYFLGGVITYSDVEKEKILHVKKESLQTKGAVSKEVVEEMAEGARSLFGSNYALAISGIAGPSGGCPEKPIGTVFGAIAERGKKAVGFELGLKVKKSRELIQLESTYRLLGRLYLKVKHGE